MLSVGSVECWLHPFVPSGPTTTTRSSEFVEGDEMYTKSFTVMATLCSTEIAVFLYLPVSNGIFLLSFDRNSDNKIGTQGKPYYPAMRIYPNCRRGA
jgi:hypothetical protein